MTTPDDVMIVEYARHGIVPPPDATLFHVALGGWAVAAGGAVAVLLGYSVTASDRFATLGVLWLGLGGLITVVSLFCAATYAAQCRSARYVSPHTYRRVCLALLLPASNFLLAIACSVLGICAVEWHSHRFLLTVLNASGRPVDDVQVVFRDGHRVDLGSVAASRTIGKRLSLTSPGVLMLHLRAGTQEWDEIGVDYVDGGTLSGEHSVDSQIEPR